MTSITIAVSERFTRARPIGVAEGVTGLELEGAIEVGDRAFEVTEPSPQDPSVARREGVARVDLEGPIEV